MIGPGRRPELEDLPRYSIAGHEIASREFIKILGVPIDKCLQLKYDTDEVMDKVNQAKEFLRHLKISGLVTNMHEWKELFESFLKSVLVHNYTPILAIDVKARIWVGRNLVYAIPYGLGIHSLVPHSLIQLLTGLDNTEETVQDQLVKGGTNLNTGKGLRHEYPMLEEIFHHGGLLSYINKMAARPSKPTDQNCQQT